MHEPEPHAPRESTAAHAARCSTSDPNRILRLRAVAEQFTGSNGLSVGQPPVIDNTEPSAGYDWKTMGEVLEDAGVSWKVLMEA